MDQIFLNKSKSETIVFIHGFYANAGYWLPYLTSFKNYRIILLNINYNDLLNSDNMIVAANSLLRNVNSGNSFYALISHSLGTVLSNFVEADLANKRFEICPVGFSKRSDTAGFISDLKSRVSQVEEEIKTNLFLVDQLIDDSRIYLQNNSIKYVPDSDQYFNYSDLSNNEISFKGDHFDINEAILDIVKRL